MGFSSNIYILSINVSKWDHVPLTMEIIGHKWILGYEPYRQNKKKPGVSTLDISTFPECSEGLG